MAIGFGFFSVFSYMLASEDAQRAQIPVTAVDNLVAGTTAKINGTIESTSQIVIELRGTGDSKRWYPLPFNVTDASGSVLIDVRQIYKSSSFRVISRGIHDDDWWSGDPVSVIGDVGQGPNGTVYMVARYVARTPEGFNKSGLADLLFTSIAVISAVIGTPGFFVVLHRKRQHVKNAGSYIFRATGWRPCGNCGELNMPSIRECPNCGWTRMWSEPKVAALPALTLATRFSDLPPEQRAGAVVFGMICPVIAFVVTFWVLFATDIGLGGACVVVPLGGILMAVVFLLEYFARKRILLSGDKIEVLKPARAKSVIPREVSMIINIHKGRNQIHFFVTRGEKVVGFGPGLSSADFEAARVWIRAFSDASGVKFWENLSMEEAVSVLQRKDPKEQPAPA